MTDRGLTYTNRPLVAYHETVCGIPYTTFIATLLAGGLYATSIVLILSLDCYFNREVKAFFSVLCTALVLVCLMAAFNIIYPHYKFNCTTLTLSLCYSGSAALVVYKLVDATVWGLCQKSDQIVIQTNNSSTTSSITLAGVFDSGYTINYIIWACTLLGLVFQALAHYFYGWNSDTLTTPTPTPTTATTTTTNSRCCRLRWRLVSWFVWLSHAALTRRLKLVARFKQDNNKLLLLTCKCASCCRCSMTFSSQLWMMMMMIVISIIKQSTHSGGKSWNRRRRRRRRRESNWVKLGKNTFNFESTWWLVVWTVCSLYANHR